MPPRFGLFPVRSPLLGESRLISVPPGTEMFQFPGLASLAGLPVSPLAGLPHSVILGSRLMCSSPWLIAAYHDLHRLSMPRHPPCALLRLISNSFRNQPRRASLKLRGPYANNEPCNSVLIPHTLYGQLESWPYITPSIPQLSKSKSAPTGADAKKVMRAR